MRIETSQIVITTEERPDGDNARAVRGFFGTLFKKDPCLPRARWRGARLTDPDPDVKSDRRGRRGSCYGLRC